MKRLIVTLLAGANVCTILALWAVCASTWLHPALAPRLAQAGLLMPLALAANLGFLLLWLYRKRARQPGDVFFRYLAWYGAGRAVIEGLRADSLMLGPVRVSQALSAALCLICVGRHSLDVSEVCQRDRDILFIDQCLFIELALVCNDLGAARVSPLALDLEQLVFDDAHQLVLVCEQALVVRDLLEELEALEAESEGSHQFFLGVVVCRADGRDDFVDVVERDDQSL